LRRFYASRPTGSALNPPVGPSLETAPSAAGQLASANVEFTTPAVDRSASDLAASVTRLFEAEPRAKTGAKSPAPDGEPTIQEVVLLIHGIRDFGEWEQMVSSILEEPGTRVLPLSYGRFDAVRFWFPIWTRDAPVKKLLRRIRDARVRFPKAKLSVIAHSFGTYAIGKILRKNPDIRLHRLILCGSILPPEFPWDHLPHSVETEIINDCGTRDIWPVLAESTTFGYGPSGRFGFGTPGVRDRYHDFGHGGFFNNEFVRQFWLPWFRRGEFVKSEAPAPSGLRWHLLMIIQIKWIAVLICLLGLWASLQTYSSSGRRSAPTPYAPSASAILITPDAMEIYLVDEDKGKIVVLENMPQTGGGLKTKSIIDLNHSGSATHPERIAFNPRTNIIYVTDPPSDEVIVIDRGHNDEIKTRISVGRLPRSIVFTLDGNKAYVSNEGPIPQGNISVIDARSHLIIGTIEGVNCPEGLATDPSNHRLYVASQCAYGEDPVLVVDTLRDKVLEEETIKNMAVGTSVAVSSEHQKLYVARGNFQSYDPETGQPGSPFTIIDLLTRRELRTHILKTSVGATVITPDEKYVLVANDKRHSDHRYVDGSCDQNAPFWCDSFGNRRFK
jgi:YVTN family beta-propeller protein